MGQVENALEAVVQRDRLVVACAVALVATMAWGWLILGAGMEMSAIEMTRMAGMDGWLMTPAVWTPAYAVLMFSMWWVMMVAMMLPGAAPVLLIFTRVVRKDRDTVRPLRHTIVFASGYLAAWTAFSLLAAASQWLLEGSGALSPMLETSNAWLSGGILTAAGLWQLTPLKARCLQHCRTPLGFLIGRWRPGCLGALRMGMEHGGYCLGCCWFLMALLFFGGVMNLYWIVGLSAFVLLEKTLPHGHRLAQSTGWLLLMAGVAVVLA